MVVTAVAISIGAAVAAVDTMIAIGLGRVNQWEVGAVVVEVDTEEVEMVGEGGEDMEVRNFYPNSF